MKVLVPFWRGIGNGAAFSTDRFVHYQHPKLNKIIRLCRKLAINQLGSLPISTTPTPPHVRTHSLTRDFPHTFPHFPLIATMQSALQLVQTSRHKAFINPKVNQSEPPKKRTHMYANCTVELTKLAYEISNPKRFFYVS